MLFGNSINFQLGQFWSFDYKDESGRLTCDRRIMVDYVNTRSHTIIGWDATIKAFRQFRTMRMRNVRPLILDFVEREGFFAK